MLSVHGTDSRARSRFVLAIVLGAFVIRVVARLASGEEAYLSDSYLEVYRPLAVTFLAGGGLCYEPGIGCAVREPLYPLLISPFVHAGGLFPWLVIVQAAIGAGVVAVAWAIAARAFGRGPALLAASFAAVSPYAVIHDTALQETVLVNGLLAWAVYALLGLSRTDSWRPCLAAGLALALAVLTSARVALVVPCALTWVSWRSAPTVGARTRKALIVALPLLVLLGGWLVRNWRLVGAPVLTTEAGLSFWAANNAWTGEFLPSRSIDLAGRASFERLSDGQRSALERLDGQEVATDRLLRGWGWQYVMAHPGQVMWNAARKVGSAASGQLSPSRGRVAEFAYSAFFVPTHVLALIGWWRNRTRADSQAILACVFVPFVVTTGVFWAHTSHKSCVDLFLFVYAASAIWSWRAQEHYAS